MPDRYGMHDPDVIDPPGKPFSYFANPNDILGAFGAPVASEITPEGYVFTGFGELMFFTGNPPRPTWQRHRTLFQGCLPAVEYDLDEDGLRYDFRLFAADLGEGLAGLPVNFIRITVTNLSPEPRAAFVSAAWRFRGPVNTAYTSLADFRFGQKFENLPAELVAGQSEFNPHWKYRFAGDALIRDGRLVYCYPSAPAPANVSLAPRDNGLRMVRFFSGEVAGDPDPTPACDPHTPLGLVTHCLPLAPGESRALTYKVPIVPLPEDSPEARQVRAADYDAVFAATMEFWKQRVLLPAPLHFPEPKVQEYLVAGTIANLLAIDRIDGGDHHQRQQVPLPRHVRRQRPDAHAAGHGLHGAARRDRRRLCPLAQAAAARRQLPHGDLPGERLLGAVRLDSLGLDRPLPPHPRPRLPREGLPRRSGGLRLAGAHDGRGPAGALARGDHRRRRLPQELPPDRPAALDPGGPQVRAHPRRRDG